MEEINLTHEERKKSDTVTYLVVGLMIFLVLFSAVQSFQIGNIEERAINGNYAVPSRASAADSSGAAAPRAAAPQMVGGC